ncbi:MAG: polysaccharide biosynthesis protein [Verrucomicrobiota bacterium]
MSFFGSISPPALDETSSPMIRRALHRAKIVGNFAIFQAVAQIIGFGSGILLVHKLDQREYAYFTIANTMQATINILADIGISVGLISIGSRIWQDRYRFGELINTALDVRKKLGAVAIIIVTPFLYFLLARNGAPISYNAILILLVVVGLLIQFSIGVLGVVPRLRADIRWIQRIDLIGAIARFIGLACVMFLFLDAAIAVVVVTATWLLQYLLLRNYVAGAIDLNAPQNSEDRKEMVRLTKHLAPNAIFYCLQGQITVFLISLFATHATSVAEVGALGRLAMIFTVLSNLLTNVFVPAFARCHEPRKLRFLYIAIVGGVTAFSLVVLAGAGFFPRQFLFVLGSKYAHLEHELFLMVSVAIGAAMTGTFWALNASKAWVTGSWLYIPLTLATQVALIPSTDFSSVSGVLVFNLISILPNLFLNLVLTYRGFRSLPHPAG